MVVQHNITAMNANRYFGINNSKLSKSLEKLSSGYAINRAGDNAAGLAVSEKMRSQIAGMTQGVKNAQDGISMVQTFEGALTETDSILQRMKTLADQAAHGTYQDDVDREAIQLEFDQLNDELNQIADTDFNGVILLNGGQMADGLKAVNGKFDYANNPRVAKQLSSLDINGIDTQGIDNADKADKLWADFGFNREDDDSTNNGPDSIDVTFQYDATEGTWKAISASNGASVKDIVTNTDANNGGFQIGSTNSYADPTEKECLANVVLDGSTLVNGDTITVTFNNPSVKNTAAENIGVVKSDSNLTVKGTGANETSDLQVEVKNETYESTYGAGKSDMTKALDELFNVLNGGELTVTYTTAEDPTFSFKGTGSDGKEYSFTTTNGNWSIGGYNFKVDVSDNVITIKDADDNDLISMTASKNGDSSDNQSTGTITYKFGIERSHYEAATNPSAKIAEPAGVVSKSNSNNYATAPLTYTDHLVMQVGARTKDSVDFTFRYESAGLGNLKANMDCSARADGLGTADLSLLDQKSANYAIDKIDNAINKVSMVRATFGSVQNRLEHKIDNMNVTIENLTSAESRIRDTNMADEMMNFTKNQILSQASQSMLAQANSLPQSVLQLLQ